MSTRTVKALQSALADIRAERKAGTLSRHFARIEAAYLLWKLAGN